MRVKVTDKANEAKVKITDDYVESIEIDMDLNSITVYGEEGQIYSNFYIGNTKINIDTN
jgi:hypothetical protein